MNKCRLDSGAAEGGQGSLSEHRRCSCYGEDPVLLLPAVAIVSISNLE